MSECAAARPVLAKYCVGLGLEIGSGGDATVPSVITFDLPRPYTKVNDVPQIMQGSCDNLHMFCDNSLDYIIQHHLAEDFSYVKLIEIIKEWRRVIKSGGLLIFNNPDQQRFKAHIAISGQGDNLAHVEQDFSLSNLKERVLRHTGEWEYVFEQDNVYPYSFYLVIKKI